ncbi:uncharacterized protein LOC119689135 [Teleopsis dalmanni]|uniref:uncharacterized protein LOC119689135 n=1 Tax=Teleopsis dalmanni TaxID=139649 RepID=UPI0018CE5DFB|nr:uncharacterized protein LOC119689135 [Teleopsis dalmanni]
MKYFGINKDMPYMSDISFDSDIGYVEDSFQKQYDDAPRKCRSDGWYSDLLNTEKEYISIISNLDNAYEVLKNVLDRKTAEDLEHFSLLEQSEKDLNTYFRKSHEQIEKFFSGSSNDSKKSKKDVKQAKDKKENKGNKENIGKQQKPKKAFKKPMAPKQPPPPERRTNEKRRPHKQTNGVPIKQLSMHLMHENTSDSDFGRHHGYNDMCCTRSEFEAMLNHNSFVNNSIDQALFERLSELSCGLSGSEYTCDSQKTYTEKDECVGNHLQFKMSDFSCLTVEKNTNFDRTMYFPSESVIEAPAPPKKQRRSYVNQTCDVRDQRDLNNYDLCHLEVFPRYSFASDMYLPNY